MVEPSGGAIGYRTSPQNWPEERRARLSTDMFKLCGRKYAELSPEQADVNRWCDERRK